MQASPSLPRSEFERRLSAVRDWIGETDADAGVWFGARSIEYLTHFYHAQTERPVVLAVTADEVRITVPKLEHIRVRDNPLIDEAYHYFDYPGGDPIATAVVMLEDLGVERVAADMDGAPGVMGYQGPALSDFVDVEGQSWIDWLRREKSDAELAVMREASKWAHLAHRYLADKIKPGARQGTVSQRASMEASRAMFDTLGTRYVPRTGIYFEGPTHTGMHSGEQTAEPHPYPANQKLREGDTIITAAEADVDGYLSEIERTMFVGDPDDEQRHYFEVMLEAQTTAIRTAGPGVEYSTVAQAVWDYMVEQGVEDLAFHHVGHGLGMVTHEPPYVDRGSEATMEPGHVFTVEPGIYVEDLGGFRHSDPVVVTDSGTELLNYWGRDLESNIVTW
ncbi:Xaa-Pro peptidase family protein [Halorubrum ejinorense]|uniref:Xaa-Pro peptidase family protein n=1 Tax=Halorubrum ejinorense TaxID=425309 RepID=A0AAV3ST98_9EURY